ncbi:MAG TPA: RluA family pseudouridine synthase [Bryobacteraceae bacterium]|nr:RluA family pseudouridine synthase [Bryobacteraceae bacterium]
MILNASSADSGKRLDVFLQEQLSGYSRSRLQDWIKAGRVRVNGSASRASLRLHSGETIEVEPAELPPLHAYAENLPLEILYQDADVVAVNKPAGMVVHAGAGRHSGTLVNALLHHFGTLPSAGGEERPGIVHRLDRLTSGVLLVARTDAAHRSLAAQFSSRRIEKVYLALVHGVVKQEQGRIERPISRDPVRRVRMTARRAEGRAAITEFRVLSRFAAFTFLEVQIKTGRTHQIRVHFSSLGHPVAGDTLYGAPARVPGMAPLERYFLHAHRVRFEQPTTGAPVTVVAPLPEELTAWMNALAK